VIHFLNQHAARETRSTKSEVKKKKKLKAAAELLKDVPAEDLLSMMKGELIDVKANESVVQAMQVSLSLHLLV
jgi:hypothetical protein